MDITKLNEYQTPINDEFLGKFPKEVVDDFFGYVNEVPYIQRLISSDRKYARDLPRDGANKIIIDLANPHILEDMSYFTEVGDTFRENGVYTKIKVDLRDMSPFMKWLKREYWRCWHGMVRPEDGEWIPGAFYFYLNYFPITQTKMGKNKRSGTRFVDFPEMWEGVYLRFHYWEQARFGGLYNNFEGGQHTAEIASRTKSKSYSAAAIALRDFLIGTDETAREKVRTLITAETDEYLMKDGIINKFTEGLTFLIEKSHFPSQLIKSSESDKTWISGYEIGGRKRGSENSLIGLPINSKPDKLRGKRVGRQIFEEFGAFSNFITTYIVGMPNVEEGGVAFGQNHAFGTGGSKGTSFQGALEFINNPSGFNVYAIPNVYDRNATGEQRTLYYFPSYMNMKGYYNKDGVSDIVGAMFEELMKRYTLKYNSSDPTLVSQRKAENSFTLKEAIMVQHGNRYNVGLLNETLNYLDQNPNIYKDMLSGRMGIFNNEVTFDASADVFPIHVFPHKDNKLHGAVLIDKLPEKDSEGKVYRNRYIAGIDTYDDDESQTLSLISVMVLDLFTDEIVAEYTGRMDFADDSYEQIRLLLMFYEAEANYEANKKGIYGYFSKMKSLYLLSDVLDFLKEKDMMTEGRGNKSKGTNATVPVKAYGGRAGADYLKSPVDKVIKDEDGKESMITVQRYSTLKFRAFIQELMAWNEDGNFDRHDAFIMLMLLREDKLRLSGGDPKSDYEVVEEEDEFFTMNFSDDSEKRMVDRVFDYEGQMLEYKRKVTHGSY